MSSGGGKRDGEGGWQRYAVVMVVGLVLLAAVYGVVRVINGDNSPRRRVMETIAMQIVPPPPPPKTEPPPEPPKTVEEKIEPPVDKPDAPKDEPPPGPLALDAQAGPGGDAFGLGGKIGGADYTGGGGTRFGHFAVMMQERISKSLHDDEKLNADKFRATIKVWLSGAGKIERVQLLHSSGSADTDSRIEQVIGAMPALPEAPPSDMPQPVIVRIGARPGIG